MMSSQHNKSHVNLMHQLQTMFGIEYRLAHPPRPVSAKT
jgi:hypothetical protein